MFTMDELTFIYYQLLARRMHFDYLIGQGGMWVEAARKDRDQTQDLMNKILEVQGGKQPDCLCGGDAI